MIEIGRDRLGAIIPESVMAATIVRMVSERVACDVTCTRRAATAVDLTGRQGYAVAVLDAYCPLTSEFDDSDVTVYRAVNILGHKTTSAEVGVFLHESEAREFGCEQCRGGCGVVEAKRHPHTVAVYRGLHPRPLHW